MGVESYIIQYVTDIIGIIIGCRFNTLYRIYSLALMESFVYKQNSVCGYKFDHECLCTINNAASICVLT